MSFGKRLAKLREELKITQGELAEKVNVKYQAISRYERNEVKPSYEFIKKIAILFPEKINWLITGNELNNIVLSLDISKDKIEEIIKLLEYAPKKYLDKIKNDLEKIKSMIED